MSIFPTRVLLATDGSEGARLASDTAATLAKGTGSELQVVCVGPGLPLYELPDYPARFEEVAEAQRQTAQTVLDTEVERLEDSGVTVAGARLAADVALELAEKLDSELHLTYVEPMPERLGGPARFAVDLPPELVASVEEEAKTKLAEQVGKVGEGRGEVARAHARVGSPSAEIVALAEELEAGLVVVGSRGLGNMRRALMGSVSDAVVRHAHCPVLVVR